MTTTTPSKCPLCHRVYCDHTCYERGQTYAQMMGDPPGTHAHREDNCCCDTCTAPGTKPPTREGRINRRVFELLQEQAVDEIRFGEMVRDDDWGRAELLTEEGSSVDVYLRGKDMPRLNRGDVSHVELADGKLFIWTGGRRKIPVSLVSVCIAEVAR